MTATAAMAATRAMLPTPSQTVGPYLAIGMAPLARPNLVPHGSPGASAVAGTVTDGAGSPVPDAVVELWQAGPDGTFENAAGEDGDHPWFGRSLTGPDGRYGFVTVKPGRLALDSGELQAPHLELLVFARGLTRPVRTRMYFPDEAAANEEDPVLSAIGPDRRPTLVAVAEGDALRFDIRLQGADETVFFAV
jgi:protocatechuate 3,4-dioxygenase, alpha subunit